jgi:hypothetical protein
MPLLPRFRCHFDEAFWVGLEGAIDDFLAGVIDFVASCRFGPSADIRQRAADRKNDRCSIIPASGF